jgi:acyl-coenzyme A thioesterase PaaI-like protein
VWPESFAGRYSAATVGVMIDERFSTVIHGVRPTARSVVTSELSVDLVHMTGSATGALRSEGEILASSVDSALARSCVRDAAGGLVATATTWCRFLEGGHRDGEPYPAAPKPPADLSLDTLLDVRADDDRRVVRATFTPSAVCGNDLGTLHGGIALAVTLEVGLAWLRTIYDGRAAASSVRLNLLRPVLRTEPSEIEVTPIHTGRTLAAATITARNPAGKPTLSATVTGLPSAP